MIIPCAGFGTRVGSPPAKELLINPLTQAPLLEHCLKVADRYQWRTVLITRPEKKTLVAYVTDRKSQNPQSSQWVMVEKTAEWPESILKSADLWSEKNILVLPDTVWSPAGVEELLVNSLDHCDCSFGVFDVQNKKTWGTVAVGKDSLRLCEKPAQALPEFKAWGLIAFKKNIGASLFSALLESTLDHEIKLLPLKAQTVRLESFTDLTRTDF